MQSTEHGEPHAACESCPRTPLVQTVVRGPRLAILASNAPHYRDWQAQARLHDACGREECPGLAPHAWLVAVDESLRTVTALQDERLASCGSCEATPEIIDLARRH